MSERPYEGDRYRVTVTALRGRVVVQVQHAEPIVEFAGVAPGYTICQLEPRVWWKPWTWWNTSIERAVRRCNRIAKRMEGREVAAERAAREFRAPSRPPKRKDPAPRTHQAPQEPQP